MKLELQGPSQGAILSCMGSFGGSQENHDLFIQLQIVLTLQKFKLWHCNWLRHSFSTLTSLQLGVLLWI